MNNIDEKWIEDRKAECRAIFSGTSRNRMNIEGGEISIPTKEGEPPPDIWESPFGKSILQAYIAACIAETEASEKRCSQNKT
jgi:hypothetical protein